MDNKEFADGVEAFNERRDIEESIKSSDPYWWLRGYSYAQKIYIKELKSAVASLEDYIDELEDAKTELIDELKTERKMT